MARTFMSFTELTSVLLALGPEDNLSAVALTPELAKDILAHDPVNRKVRSGNLAKLRREIEGGHWDPRKCTALRFLPSGRMVDGQHRCLAVIEAKMAVLVPMCVVPDTLGVDEGANRTLVDHLMHGYGLGEIEANQVSAVTKALCHVYGAGNREYLQYFQEHQAFILDSARKPLGWVADQMPAVAAVFKPPVIAVMRARAIHENNEPAESVDQLLYDAINGGATAPEGSARRALAKQFYDAMQGAFTGKKAKPRDMMKWLIAALKFDREGIMKNILTARLPGNKKKRAKKSLAREPVAA